MVEHIRDIISRSHGGCGFEPRRGAPGSPVFGKVDRGFSGGPYKPLGDHESRARVTAVGGPTVAEPGVMSRSYRWSPQGVVRCVEVIGTCKISRYDLEISSSFASRTAA